MRDWAVKRRERTRHLIELGGLVIKAGLVDLVDDDRATLYGAFRRRGQAARRGPTKGAGPMAAQGQACL
ncbi:conjugal transfer protein TraD [Sphingobium scionense]